MLLIDGDRRRITLGTALVGFLDIAPPPGTMEPMETAMKTLESPSATNPAGLAELSHAIDNAVKGVRDPEAMRRASARMDRIREEMGARTGLVSIAVDLLRESRDES